MQNSEKKENYIKYILHKDFAIQNKSINYINTRIVYVYNISYNTGCVKKKAPTRNLIHVSRFVFYFLETLQVFSLVKNT